MSSDKVIDTHKLINQLKMDRSRFVEATIVLNIDGHHQ